MRRLLSLFRFGILGILAAVVVIWFGSLIYFSRNDTASPKKAPLATGQILLPSPATLLGDHNGRWVRMP